jgi:hypothetical protein
MVAGQEAPGVEAEEEEERKAAAEPKKSTVIKTRNRQTH